MTYLAIANQVLFWIFLFIFLVVLIWYYALSVYKEPADADGPVVADVFRQEMSAKHREVITQLPYVLIALAILVIGCNLSK